MLLAGIREDIECHMIEVAEKIVKIRMLRVQNFSY